MCNVDLLSMKKKNKSEPESALDHVGRLVGSVGVRGGALGQGLVSRQDIIPTVPELRAHTGSRQHPVPSTGADSGRRAWGGPTGARPGSL